MKYIYLAHPISKGNQFQNVRNAVIEADKLMKLGYIVFNPGLSALHDMIIKDTPYELYMTQDFAWIEKCDCLIRLPGESSGADREIEHARANGKQVFYGVRAFLDYVDQFSEADIRKLTSKPITAEKIFEKED
jgi:hypothetical protein